MFSHIKIFLAIAFLLTLTSCQALNKSAEYAAKWIDVVNVLNDDEPSENEKEGEK